MNTSAQRSIRHGDLPNAMLAAASAILDEAGPHEVGLRETARRVGVSATTAYRYFSCKEDLLASVAAEGFWELAAAIDAARKGPDSLIGPSLAYVEFALRKRGLFRLMFGPILVERAKYPQLEEAAAVALDVLRHSIAVGDESLYEQDTMAMASWGMIHGLSSLLIDGLVPEASARSPGGGDSWARCNIETCGLRPSRRAGQSGRM